MQLPDHGRKPVPGEAQIVWRAAHSYSGAVLSLQAV